MALLGNSDQLAQQINTEVGGDDQSLERWKKISKCLLTYIATNAEVQTTVNTTGTPTAQSGVGVGKIT